MQDWKDEYRNLSRVHRQVTTLHDWAKEHCFDIDLIPLYNAILDAKVEIFNSNYQSGDDGDDLGPDAPDMGLSTALPLVPAPRDVRLILGHLEQWRALASRWPEVVGQVDLLERDLNGKAPQWQRLSIDA